MTQGLIDGSIFFIVWFGGLGLVALGLHIRNKRVQAARARSRANHPAGRARV